MNKLNLITMKIRSIFSQPDFELNAIQHFVSSKKISFSLPAKSITTVSSYLLINSDKGIIIQ